MKAVCAYCGKPLNPMRHAATRYCNLACQQANRIAVRRAETLKHREVRPCQRPTCKKSIPASRRTQAKYCSEVCQREVSAAARHARLVKTPRTCKSPTCGNLIPWGEKVLYCRKECRPSYEPPAPPPVVHCTVCNTIIKGGTERHLYCGAECSSVARRERDANHRREGAPTIEIAARPDNETPLETQARLAAAWPEFREAMLAAALAWEPMIHRQRESP